ncbi:MAG: cellulase family glycosylhydrolase [Atopobiaceae bacterium]|nr:cellulase family glycosylhydrolase [Atopobiaceae bacterium]
MRSRYAVTLFLILGCVLFALTGCHAEGQAEPHEPEPPAAPASMPAPTDVARPSTAGKLHVNGTQLVGENGEPVTLFGISTHGLAWFPQYVNADLFSELSAWGANVMRLALYTDENGGYCAGGDQAQLRGLVLDGVRFATDADMYVIVDWHILSDNNPWDHADQAKEFLSAISAELADHNNVLYEICNEPNGSTTWDDVRSYAKEVIPLIRANDPDAVVIVGTPEWSQRVDQAAESPLDEQNVMCALHFYAATHRDDLRSRMVSAVQAGLPVFVSEFGICDASGNGAIDEASADAWLATMDELGISRVMWNLSNKNESSAMIWSGCDKVSGFEDEDLSRAGQWLKARLAGERDASATPTTAAAGEDQASSSSAGTDVTTFTQGDLTVSVRLENSWPVDGGICHQYTLVVRNDGEARDSWHVDVPFNEDVTLVGNWNGRFSVSGNTVQIDNEGYNGTLDTGQSATDIGLQVSGSSQLGLSL